MNCRLCGDRGLYRGISASEQICSCSIGVDLWERQRRNCNVPMETAPLQLAFKVRCNIESYVVKRKLDRAMKNLCAFASMSLAFAYDRAGLKWRLCSGVYQMTMHVWLVHEQQIIDLTFTQFDRDAARVSVFAESDPRFSPYNIYDNLRSLLLLPNGGGPVSIIKRMARV